MVELLSSPNEDLMKLAAGALLALTIAFSAATCGGSPPNSPSSTGTACAPILGPTSMSLHTGDLFRFKFTVPSGTDADVLVTFIGGGGISGLSASALTVRLFDGTALLGAVENYQDGVALWKSAASPFPGSPSVVVDFRRITNGGIDGRVEFTVTRGSILVDRLDLATAELMRSRDAAEIGAPVISARDRELCR
jgi:hypothetical protein